jgi:hypothetical protein
MVEIRRKIEIDIKIFVENIGINKNNIFYNVMPPALDKFYYDCYFATIISRLLRSNGLKRSVY